MGHSFRKTPICGMTTAESDKWFKTFENRKQRRAVRSALNVGNTELPHHKEYGNPWASQKDGKSWFGDKYPHLMRK